MQNDAGLSEAGNLRQSVITAFVFYQKKVIGELLIRGRLISRDQTETVLESRNQERGKLFWGRSVIFDLRKGI
jgi:hypothetical protein